MAEMTYDGRRIYPIRRLDKSGFSISPDIREARQILEPETPLVKRSIDFSNKPYFLNLMD